MMKCMAMLAACLGLCVTALPARASGGVMCEAADDSLAFDFSAGQSRDGAGDWFGLQGKLVSKIDHLPPDLARFVIGRENLTEHWADRDSVRLEIEKQGDEK
jgi:hypothetical protein